MPALVPILGIALPKQQRSVPQSFGERVAHARRLLGVTKLVDLSQADLAKLVDVDESTIHRWESDLRKPRDASLLRLAKVLGVTAGWLDHGAGPMYPDAKPPTIFGVVADLGDEAQRKQG